MWKSTHHVKRSELFLEGRRDGRACKYKKMCKIWTFSSETKILLLPNILFLERGGSVTKISEWKSTHRASAWRSERRMSMQKEEIEHTFSYASIYRDQCEKKRDENSDDFHYFLISFGCSFDFVWEMKGKNGKSLVIVFSMFVQYNIII